MLEIKRTLNGKTLTSALAQLEASSIRLQMVADFLGVKVETWHYWVAFHKDDLHKNPVFYKHPVAQAGNPQAMAVHMWLAKKAKGGAIVQYATLRPIPLEDAGDGVMGMLRL